MNAWFSRYRTATALVILASVVFLPALARELNQGLQAFWLSLATHRDTPSAPITLVAIDEAAIDALGAWPWPRQTWAEMFQRLHERHTPALSALDIVFPADPTQTEGNRYFAEQLVRGPAVVGQLLLPDPGLRGAVAWTPLTLNDESQRAALGLRVLDYPGALGNTIELGLASRAGHINARIDPDGRMRSLPMVLCTQAQLEQCSISLFPTMAAALLNVSEWQLIPGRWWQAPWYLSPIDMPELAIPVDEHLRSLIPWRHPAGLPYLSILDIWEGTAPPQHIDQRILLFGGVSMGLGDIATSPLRHTVPGMEVHAQLLSHWLANSLPYEPRGGAFLSGLLGLLFAVLLISQADRARRLWLLGLLAPALLLGASAVAWWTTNAMWPIAPTVVFILAASALLLMRQAIHERGEILSRVEPYLPVPLRRLLAGKLARIPDETGWGTVMVADILGYTRQSQRLPLSQLAAWCDQGVDHIIQHALAHGGLLDTVAGDGVLLLWRQDGDIEQAEAAYAAAQAILDNLPALNEKLTQQGLPEMSIGLGLHAAPYLLGSLGRRQKRYTVVSEAANLAAHIERATRDHPWPILMSQRVAQALPADRTCQVAQLKQEDGRTVMLYTIGTTPAYHWSFATAPAAPASL